MAKAVIPIRAWRRREGTARDLPIESRLRELFSAQISGEASADETRPPTARNGN
jgi:hypothetical protein